MAGRNRTADRYGARGRERPGLVALAALALTGLLTLVPAEPGGAAVFGIGGRVATSSGAPVEGLVVDLFAANADGSRGRFLGDTRTTGTGAWWFDQGDGCYVVTLVAEPGRSFTTGSRWLQRPVCVNGRLSPGGVDGTLDTPVVPAAQCGNGGRPVWNMVFEDHFSGDGVPLHPSWQTYDSTGNAGYGLRRPHAISQWGGHLNIRASMENGVLVSGGMSHSISQTYGRYEFRVRTDRDRSESTSGVVLTWPRSNAHPRDGENNIYETLARPGDRSEFYSFIHKPYGTVHEQDYTVHHADASQWHTMVMEWAPDHLIIYRNGQVIKHIAESDADLIPDNPHFLAIQLDAWKHSIPAPVWMQVDYARIWSYGGKNPC